MNGNPSARGEDSAETSGLAIASLFLGIIWLFGVGSILAILLGLLGMKERAASFGGMVTIQCDPGKGTTIIACLPRRRS